MVHPTFRTFPLSDIQRQFIDNMSTISTPFRAWKPAVDFNQFSPIPLAFVGKLANQFAPTSIANRKSEFMVFHHIFDSQILNHYRLIFTNQLSCQLMQKIFPSIGNLSVDSSHFNPCFMSVVTPFLFARKSLLQPFQLLAELFEVSPSSGAREILARSWDRSGSGRLFAFLNFNTFLVRQWKTSNCSLIDHPRPSEIYDLSVLVGGESLPSLASHPAAKRSTVLAGVFPSVQITIAILVWMRYI
jgi:hypothetical protein